MLLTMFFMIGVSFQNQLHAQNSMMNGPMMKGYESMQNMETMMMGTDKHNQMMQLMNKMMKEGVTPQEQKQMVQMMQDRQMGPGMMTMMMRNMMSTGGMMGYGGIFGPNLVTTVLIWIVLVLAILGLWTYISGKK